MDHGGGGSRRSPSERSLISSTSDKKCERILLFHLFNIVRNSTDETDFVCDLRAWLFLSDGWAFLSDGWPFL
jgi:hypothetical protein